MPTETPNEYTQGTFVRTILGANVYFNPGAGKFFFKRAGIDKWEGRPSLKAVESVLRKDASDKKLRVPVKVFRLTRYDTGVCEFVVCEMNRWGEFIGPDGKQHGRYMVMKHDQELVNKFKALQKKEKKFEKEIEQERERLLKRAVRIDSGEALVKFQGKMQ